MIIPPQEIRKLIGPFGNDKDYENSAKEGIESLRKYTSNLRIKNILDLGCGCGRIAGLIPDTFPDLQSFVGVDVNHTLIEFCKKTYSDPRFRFQELNLGNSIWAPNKHGLFPDLGFLGAQKFDMVYAFSVFTHTKYEMFCAWLGEIAKYLSDSGMFYFTLFIKRDTGMEPLFSFKHQRGQDYWIDDPLHPEAAVAYSHLSILKAILDNNLRVISVDYGKWNSAKIHSQDTIIVRRN